MNKIFDCAIIGGGPAGLSAALVLGRARRNTILFDNNKPRNAVTHESHGFITRDGIKPNEFREMAHKDIEKYPSVIYEKKEVTSLTKDNHFFELITDEKQFYRSKTVIISTGLKDILPNIESISDYYGKSLFNCPYCDGWELRDKPLVVIIDDQAHVFHFIQTIYNWSKDLLVCTNGNPFQNPEQKRLIQNKGIKINENKIKKFVGRNGQMEEIIFENNVNIIREGGFVMSQVVQSSNLAKQLGCKNNPIGGISIDSFGRTNIEGVYAAGDAPVIAPAQLIMAAAEGFRAAAEGFRAAAGVNTDLIQKDFL